jgi:hypothetical protein
MESDSTSAFAAAAFAISIITVIVVVIGGVTAWRSQRSQVLSSLLADLQSDRMRDARRVIYEIYESGGSLLDKKPRADLDGRSPWDIAEYVCHHMNTAGVLARKHLISLPLLLDVWAPGVTRIRIAVDELICARRKPKPDVLPNGRLSVPTTPGLWYDFDWLARKAVAHERTFVRYQRQLDKWEVSAASLRAELKRSANDVEAHAWVGPPDLD